MRLRQRPPMPTDDVHALRQQYDAVLRENAVLARELASAQGRSTRMRVAHRDEVEQLQAALLRSRADAIAQRTSAAAARDELATLRQAEPGLPRRLELTAHIERLMDTLRSLRRDRLGRQLREERQAKAAAAAIAQPAAPRWGDLREKSVLCVGSEPSLAALSQRLVEIAGGRFLRHDGDEADTEGTADAAALEASLQAADLVICQTGCLSHGAYWRVQDHCRRTGKQCVLLDQPAQTVQVVRGPRELPVAAVGSE